jgi:hypothetical protein
MKIEAAYGDVVDRIAILLLKERHVADPARLDNVRTELTALRDAWRLEGLPAIVDLPSWDALADVNARLWDVEDALRDCERRGEFGAEFVTLARSVYRLNDARAELKRKINVDLGSPIVEEKAYRPY